MKCCRKCLTTQPDCNFAKAKKNKDGLDNMYKSCKNKAGRKHYDLNSDRIKLQQRESYLESKGRKLVSVMQYQKDFPNKVRAHRAVNDAIRRGKLKQLPCQVCGMLGTVAHHDDYLKPLQVRWLCPAHHAEWHTKNGEAANGR